MNIDWSQLLLNPLYASIFLTIIIMLLYKMTKYFSGGGKIKADYLRKSDPNAQEKYNATLPKDVSLTSEERIDLSWVFLYQITENVLNKFSKEDREAVNEIGRKLIGDQGAYEHIVDYGIKRKKKTSRIAEQSEAQQTQNIKSA